MLYTALLNVLGSKQITINEFKFPSVQCLMGDGNECDQRVIRW